MMFKYLNKPEYFYQPKQIFKKILDRKTIVGQIIVKLPWKDKISINPSENIGKSIYNTSIYDLAVTEAIFRICQPGDCVVDVGANIGYTSLLMNFSVGQTGKVYSFEPHPDLYKKLITNLKNNDYSTKNTFEIALSDQNGTGHLVIPDDFITNEGLSFVSKSENTAEKQIKITLKKLDDVLNSENIIKLIKLDVEGHEINVLKGAEMLLNDKKIINILFECNYDDDTVLEYLKTKGYEIFRLDKTLFKLKLMNPSSKKEKPKWEPTNFIATINREALLKTFEKSGYLSLI